MALLSGNTVKMFRYRFNKKIGRHKKNWPVKAYKREKRGEDWVLSYDRARRVPHPDEPDDEQYEFLHEKEPADTISYEYIQTDAEGEDYVKVLMPEKGYYCPYRIDFNQGKVKVLTEDGEKKLDLGNDAASFELEDKNFYNWAVNALERKNEMVNEEDESWWAQNQTLVIYLGAGLFFFITALAINKLYAGKAMQAAAQITQAQKGIDQNMKELKSMVKGVALLGSLKIKQWKNQS